MDLDPSTTELIALAVVVLGPTAHTGRHQTKLFEWIITELAVPSRYKGLTNLGVGVGIPTTFTLIGAAAIGEWGVVPIGLLAGVFASVEAARVHDVNAAKVTESRNEGPRPGRLPDLEG